MRQYHDLLRRILSEGVTKQSRGILASTGSRVTTRSIFGHQMRFDLRAGFPLVTTKRLPFRTIATELFWFLSGRTDNQWLNDRDVTIWDEWADAATCEAFGRKQGQLGPIYGHQWRNFGATKLPDGSYAKNGRDQIEWVIGEIKRNPDSRRLLVSAWNPAEVDQVSLPPCHTFFQFYVSEGNLSCQFYQRSADVFLGVPFNIASYALLTHLIARVTGLGVGDLVHSIGDAHLYNNQFAAAEEQLTREPRQLPNICLDETILDISTFTIDHIRIDGYDPYPSIRVEVVT